MPLDQQQRPPPSSLTATQLPYTSSYSNQGSGSVGPLIAVLAVVTVLGALAALVGRLCSGRGIMGGHGQYDIETWLDEKCSSCIDGRMNPPPLPSSDLPAGSFPLPPSIPVQTNEETKKDKSSHHNPPRPSGAAS